MREKIPCFVILASILFFVMLDFSGVKTVEALSKDENLQLSTIYISQPQIISQTDVQKLKGGEQDESSKEIIVEGTNREISWYDNSLLIRQRKEIAGDGFGCAAHNLDKYPFGTKLFICNGENARCAVVTVNDYMSEDRFLDLQKEAFAELENLGIGILHEGDYTVRILE